jgi:predicted TIM-barrel fold metal-dependent hydrolase
METASARIRARLPHPIVDSDGHTIEIEAAVASFVERLGGRAVRERYEAALDGFLGSFRLAEGERRARRVTRGPFWAVPAENTLDRATAMLPRLLDERLPSLGIDFAVIYPSAGLPAVSFADAELRQVACRAFNAYHAELFAPHARRLRPAAIIPMHTPEEALAELDHAVGTLGMKVVMLAGLVHRPLEAAARLSREAAALATWVDTLGLDSAHDYDPVWRRCVELRVCPTFHSAGYGWGARRSISSYVYNHIGNFAAAGEATCKSLFLGGVTRRFPSLRFAFLEGGVAWAAGLLADLVSHWSKRGRDALAHLDPRRFDRARFAALLEEYGDEALRELLRGVESPGALAGDLAAPLGSLDEFAACGVESVEQIVERFAQRFYFGCEADDATNARAFDPRNPLGTRLGAIFSSDLGHWDVPDIARVVEEAWEQVEHGVISEEEFHELTFGHPVRFWAALDPDFFAGTSVEAAAKQLLAAPRRAP